MTPGSRFAPGCHIGPYVIGGELGEGGMGVVYRARHTLLDRAAAIKVLRPELGSHPLLLDRFLTEARATTAIRHPGIVEVYDYGHTDDGCAYIAMELLQGTTLGARIEQRGTTSVAEALLIARRIAAPLAVAHEVGVVHRDLKPDNVFLVRDPEGGAVDNVKLLDFGIAKLESAGNRTTIGVVLGTPAYMAPEQCRGLADCDHRVDLYALGCILYELITGAPPYGRNGATTDLIVAHVEAPVPRLSPTVAPEVARLVSRLLAKAPADRPRSAVEVVVELDRLLTITPPPQPGPRTTLRLAIATAASLALTLSSIGAWYRSRRATPMHSELGPQPRALGSSVRSPADAGVDAVAAVSLAPTIPVDAALHPPTVALKKPRDANTSEVTTELSAPRSTADINTTVSP